jgi:hypothetical protein
MADKKLERRYVLLFKECLPNFPAGDIVDEESPDFLVHTSGGPFGIELTELFHPAPAEGLPSQANESLENRTVAKAKQLYESFGGPPLIVRVGFSSQAGLTKSRIQSLAPQIAELVSHSTPATDERVRLHNQWRSNDTFPVEIDSIAIARPSYIKKTHWSTSRAGGLWHPTTAEIQAVISGKDKLVESYRKKCASVWLLMITSGEVPSQLIEPPLATLCHSYVTSFDRVFSFESFGRRVHELQILRS